MKYTSHKIKHYGELFALLGSASRLAIIATLLEGPRSVSEIVLETGLQQTAVSHDLRKLAECQFVTAEPKGKQRIYRVNADTVKPLFDQIDRHLRLYCKTACNL